VDGEDEEFAHGRTVPCPPSRKTTLNGRFSSYYEFATHRRAEDLDGTLVLAFSSDSGGGRVETALVNAPDHLYDKLLANWPMRYRDPWRSYLARSR
jgi:hypothetical protein